MNPPTPTPGQADAYWRDMGRGVFIPAHYTPDEARAFLTRMGDESAVRTIKFDGEAVVVAGPQRESKPVYPAIDTGD